MSYLSNMEYGVEIERFGESYRVDVLRDSAFIGRLAFGTWRLIDACQWDGDSLDGITKNLCPGSDEASEIVLCDLAEALVEFESSPDFSIEEDE